MEDRIILIDKPAGISSFGIVAKIRGKLKAELGKKVKVGHTGTLDPFATGLLILLTGKMTKKSSDFLKLDKTYEATLKLGFTSTTGDPEGEIREVISSKHSENLGVQYQPIEDHARPTGRERATEPRNDGREGARPKLVDIELVLSPFIGKITQTPPKFSAIKINGQRAYKLARKGADFEGPSREVTIYNIEILDYNYPELRIRCDVSSGTYIRTLAEDIGEKLGTGAYLTALRRIKIGDYDIKDAKTLDMI